MIRVLYNGLERADFIFYLACILSTKSNRVIVNDSSKSKDLFNSVSRQSTDNIYEWRNIIFVKGLEESANEFNEDDIFIDYRGENIEPARENMEDTFHFVMADYTEKGISLIKALETEGKSIYIMRDFCTKKVTDKSIAIDCQLEKDAIAGHMMFNLRDMAAYVALTHNGKQKFSKCSEDMHLALNYAISLILGINKEKDVKKIVNKANRIIK